MKSELTQDFTARRFNRRLFAAAASVLVLTVLASCLIRPPVTDFGQYYMGGRVALTGRWAALYPIPKPVVRSNLAWPEASSSHPDYAAEAAARRVHEPFRFIQIPPFAVGMVPLAMLPYPVAKWIWMLLMLAALLGVMRQAMWVTNHMNGTPTRLAGIIAALIALSPIAYRTGRLGNITPVIAWTIGEVIVVLLRSGSSIRPAASRSPAAGPFRAGFALAFGLLLKYTTPILLPLAAIRGAWKAIIWFVALTGILVLASLPVTGLGPWREFSLTVAPTLVKSHPSRANRAFEALLMRIYRTDELPKAAQRGLAVARWATGAVLLGLIWWRHRVIRVDDSAMLAAGLLLVAWLITFGPILWEHYPLYLAPWWGWLVLEARRSRSAQALAWAAVVLCLLALPAVPWLVLPEPLNSSQLWGILILSVLAGRRLVAGPSGRPGERAVVGLAT